MGGRPTNAEVLAKLDAADNPVTRSSLKDVCVSRLRDAVDREAGKDAEIERLRGALQEIKEDYEHDRACGLEQDRTGAYYETACQALANQTTESRG